MGHLLCNAKSLLAEDAYVKHLAQTFSLFTIACGMEQK